jgi:signal transduction histidine kinase
VFFIAHSALICITSIQWFRRYEVSKILSEEQTFKDKYSVAIISTVCVAIATSLVIYASLRAGSLEELIARLLIRTLFSCFVCILPGRMQLCSVLSKLYRAEADALRETLEVKRNFVRYIGHEIRTPLNTVCMGLELVETKLKDIDVSEDVFEDLVELKVSVDTAVYILNDLLAYEKLESGTT